MGFLFDNDGVLIDSSEWHWKAWQKLEEEDPRCKMKKEEFIHTFGMRNDLILEKLFPHLPQNVRHQWAIRKEELFRKLAKGNIELLPGMEDFLITLNQTSYPHIIASSTPIKNLQMYLESTILGKYFTSFVSAEEVSHGKPFPDVFLAAAERIKVPPSSCIVIEDAPAGIQAGKSAGCFVVALATTHRAEQLSDYDLLFPSPRDLDLIQIQEAFEKWKKKAK